MASPDTTPDRGIKPYPEIVETFPNCSDPESVMRYYFEAIEPLRLVDAVYIGPEEDNSGLVVYCVFSLEDRKIIAQNPNTNRLTLIGARLEKTLKPWVEAIVRYETPSQVAKTEARFKARGSELVGVKLSGIA